MRIIYFLHRVSFSSSILLSLELDSQGLKIITVDSYASLFDCRPVDRASYCLMASTFKLS